MKAIERSALGSAAGHPRSRFHHDAPKARPAPPPTTTAPVTMPTAIYPRPGMRTFVYERPAHLARAGSFANADPAAQRCAAPPCNTPPRQHGAAAVPAMSFGRSWPMPSLAASLRMVLVQFLPPAVSDAHFVAWKAPRQRRAALAACCMAARRIVGRPGRRWRTSQRAQHAPGVRKRRRACPAAGKSPLVWAPGLLWWAAAPTGLWAHHDGRVSEGGRPADPSADRSIAFKR